MCRRAGGLRYGMDLENRALDLEEGARVAGIGAETTHLSRFFTEPFASQPRRPVRFVGIKDKTSNINGIAGPTFEQWSDPLRG